MKQQELEKSQEYKYGFVTDIESVKAPKGLNEEVIRFISKIFRSNNVNINNISSISIYSRCSNIY